MYLVLTVDKENDTLKRHGARRPHLVKRREVFTSQFVQVQLIHHKLTKWVSYIIPLLLLPSLEFPRDDFVSLKTNGITIMLVSGDLSLVLMYVLWRPFFRYIAKCFIQNRSIIQYVFYFEPMDLFSVLHPLKGTGEVPLWPGGDDRLWSFISYRWVLLVTGARSAPAAAASWYLTSYTGEC